MGWGVGGEKFRKLKILKGFQKKKLKMYGMYR